MEHTVKDILGRFDHVDYLVNNAGRSIRRSVVNQTDRLHDYERVMAVNYFGAVRMVLALLPHWRERRFGHVVNVSSAGVQARSPKYSAYLPTKAALDAFSEVVATETLSDHVTFTNIHMPLVATPMIKPSRQLNPVPPITAEHAAAMVVRGLIDKPSRIDTPLGTLSEAGHYFTPKLSRRILHQLYPRLPGFGRSARGGSVRSSGAPKGVAEQRSSRQPKRPARAAVARSGCPVRSNDSSRLVPGVHWYIPGLAIPARVTLKTVGDDPDLDNTIGEADVVRRAFDSLPAFHRRFRRSGASLRRRKCGNPDRISRGATGSSGARTVSRI